MLANTTNLRHKETHSFNISVWFLLSLGILMFKSGGLAVYAVCGALIHELGHLLAIFASGCSLKYASFNLGGIRMGLKETPSRKRLLLILLSGCAANIFAVVAFKIFGGDSLRGFIFVGGNLVLCALNLLPHSSLDGGKLLRLALSSSANCEKIVFASDVAVVFILTLLGGLVFMLGGKNPTALLLALCLVAKLPIFGKKKH